MFKPLIACSLVVGLGAVAVGGLDPGVVRAAGPDTLLFTSNRDGLPKLYWGDPDMAVSRLFHETQGSESLPAWSPDGKKISFASSRSGNHDIWVMDANGENLKQLTTDRAPDFVTSWSPDGTKIAFTTERAGNSEVFVMNADGSEQTNLTHDPGFDGDPAWSPDGKQILFTSNRGGDGYFLYLMDPDGTNIHRFSGKKTGGGPVFGAWSPDGKQIAYGNEDGAATEVYIASADGARVRKLTALGGINTFPAWSPDGEQIALFHYDNRETTGSLWVVTVKDAVQSYVGEAGSYMSGRPAWRPVH